MQFDRQCEENRADYFMRLLDLAALRDAARDGILQALPATDEGWDRDWTVNLLEALATDGDALAYDALRSLASTGYERAQDGLACTGEVGLQWVAEHVLPSLPDDEMYRIGFWLPDEEADDATPLQKRLRVLYLENDAAREARRKARPETPPTARAFFRTLDEPSGPSVSGWEFARVADARQRRRAARRFLRETETRPLRRLVQAFRHGGFPLPARRLIRHAFHPDRGGEVMRVLGTIRHPSVRRFALGLLRRRPLPWNALEALDANLRAGDERPVLAALRSVEGEDNVTRHNPILDVVGFMRTLPEGKWQPHAEWIYAHSPCSMCRASAVDWMAEHGTVPEAFLAEMPFDAESDIREAAAAFTTRAP